ncbi:MAG: hypothetical protein N3A58_00370 [Spirochaetes bacterium]|nr:hypothetical protein [Spirochaetota bacterium]
MDKYIIIIGGGILQIPVINQAYEMGFIPIVFDYNEKAPAFSYNFVNKVICSTLDEEKASDLAYDLSKKYSIYGVLTVGTDASRTVSAIAEKLNLYAISYDKALITTNKVKLRNFLKEKKVNQVDFTVANSKEEFDKIIDGIKNKRLFPNGAVVKPSTSMGARGVYFINDEVLSKKDLFDEVINLSKDGKILIEEFSNALELSIDAIIYDRKVNITGVAIRYIQEPPYFVEHGHLMPADIDEELIDAGVKAFIDGIKAVDIDIGAAKGDIFTKYIIDPNGKKVAKGFVSELASRLSGGFMSTHTYPYSTGVNLMKNIIDVHTGNPPSDLSPKWNIWSLEMGILPQKEGILKKIKGVYEAKMIPTIKDVIIYRNIGDKVFIPYNNVTKAGSIIGAHKDKEYLIDCVKKALNTVKLEIE